MHRLPLIRCTWPLAIIAPLASAVYAGDTQLATELIATTDRPLYLTHAPGDEERLFIAAQREGVRLIKNGELIEKPFLDLGELLQGAGNQGLYSLAFHPNYETNGFVYLSYIEEFGADSIIERYQVTADPDVADPKSGQIVLRLPGLDPPGHELDWIGFGPNDGYLYASLGDGSTAEFYDLNNNAQNLEVLRGKILRIDVDGDDFPEDSQRNYAIPPDNPFAKGAGADEIWAYGLRNPWRCSFDRATGDLYIGDNGHLDWEELNYQPASSLGGENYGWDCKEGAHCTPEKRTCDCDDPNLTDPIFEYLNPKDAEASIMGGYVYRGCVFPDLVGAYVFADRFGRAWTLRHDAGEITELTEIQDQLALPEGELIVAFGEDAAGELYICNRENGNIYKIVPPDAVVGDINGDGVVGSTDLILLLGAWGPCDDCGDCCPADLDGDCTVGTGDLIILLGNWG